MRRLVLLRERGVIDNIPTGVQLAVGATDMLRFWISPAAADYYDSRSIHYGFHQLLRFLDEPASLVDPIGILSTRDGIIGHLMQVVHANPRYDLDLLQVFDDGLAALEAQLCEMLDGTHVRSGSISAVVEEPDYHARLLDYVRAYRIDPDSAPPLRANIEHSAEFRRIERTFGSLRAAMRYFCRVPTQPVDAIVHVLRTREFPFHLGEA